MKANNPLVPYNDLPDLPPLSGLDMASLQVALIDSRVALAKLDEAVKHSRFTFALRAIVPIVESQASSAIENIVTTSDDLFSSAIDAANSGDVQLDSVIRYHRAMSIGETLMEKRPISDGIIIRLCSEILGREMRYRDLPGTVVASKEERIYMPPEGQALIKSKMNNWIHFVNESPLDPLVVIALAHYQFEAIHPFPDGNGRTGRILNFLLLKNLGLLSEPVLHLSRVLKDSRTTYYELIRQATEDFSYTTWVKYILNAIHGAADLARAQLDELEDYFKDLQQIVRSGSISKIPTEALEVITEFPYSKITHVVNKCGVTRQTAAKWLQELERLGIVSSITRGRDKYFVNHQLVRILKFE